jgi:hypothetical protein
VAKEEFAYRARKDGSVAISWRGRTVKVLTGSTARRFLNRVMGASPMDAQNGNGPGYGELQTGERRPTEAERNSVKSLWSLLTIERTFGILMFILSP